MIKKHFPRFLMFLLFVSLVIFVGYKPKETTFNPEVTIMENQPELATTNDIAVRTKQKLGLDIEKEKNAKLKLNLTFTDDGSETIPVKGSGSLKINDQNFLFDIQQSGSNLKKVTGPGGKEIYYGPIEGKIKNKSGQEEGISIGATFTLQGDGVYSVFVGEIGNESIVFFGEQFIDEQTYKLMSEKGW